MNKTIWLSVLFLATFTQWGPAQAQGFLSPGEIAQPTERGEIPTSTREAVPIGELDDIIPKSERRRIDENRRRRGLTGIQSLGMGDYFGLPSGVDLRHRDTPIKKQFGGTCTTFGLVAAMENKLDDPGALDISERHFWSLYRQ